MQYKLFPKPLFLWFNFYLNWQQRLVFLTPREVWCGVALKLNGKRSETLQEVSLRLLVLSTLSEKDKWRGDGEKCLQRPLEEGERGSLHLAAKL